MARHYPYPPVRTSGSCCTRGMIAKDCPGCNGQQRNVYSCTTCEGTGVKWYPCSRCSPNLSTPSPTSTSSSGNSSSG